MHKELVSTHQAAVRGGGRSRLPTGSSKTRPVPAAKKSDSSRNKIVIVPNVECKVCVDHNNSNVINTKVAQQYLVPITTKGPTTKSRLANGKSKKVALLPKSSTLTGTARELSRPLPPTVKPVPTTASSTVSSELKRHLTHTKLSPAKRRDLAYLVVELNNSPTKERKKSFDDLDAELEFRTLREDRTSLSRSSTISTISTPRPQPRTLTDQMPAPKIKFSPSTSRKSVSQKQRLALSPSGNGRQSQSNNTDSAESAELSSDTLLSSCEQTSSPTSSRRRVKHPSRRAPPPPPPSTLPRPAPTLLTPSQPSRPLSTNDPISPNRRASSGPCIKPPTSYLEHKRSSVGQLKGGGLPFKRPSPMQKSKHSKLKESRSISAPNIGEKPSISNPQLISATNSVASSKPISGPFRNLPSPPATPTTQTHLLHTHDEHDVNSPYEEVDFEAPSVPVPPPRPKRDKRRQSKSSAQKPSFLSTKPKPKSPVPLPDKTAPSKPQRPPPEEYLEPTVTCTTLGGERRDSEEEDGGGVGDYVDMEPGVLSDWVIHPAADEDFDEPDDSYVEMQLGPGAFANDSPEPLYVEMNAMDFKPPSPAQKQESLYYATMDLFQHRTDLQVNDTRKKGKPLNLPLQGSKRKGKS